MPLGTAYIDYKMLRPLQASINEASSSGHWRRRIHGASALEGLRRWRGVIFMITIILTLIHYHHNPKARSMMLNIPSFMGGNNTGENDTCMSTGLPTKSVFHVSLSQMSHR